MSGEFAAHGAGTTGGLTNVVSSDTGLSLKIVVNLGEKYFRRLRADELTTAATGMAFILASTAIHWNLV